MSAQTLSSALPIRTGWRDALSGPAGALLLLLLASVAAYGRSLGGEFLWDDNFLVEHNPLIRSPSLALETFRHFLFIDSASTFYRPVQNLSYQLDYALWGLDPFGFRWTNLLLHAGNGWLLYLLGRRLLPRFGVGTLAMPRVALGIALLWTVHPVHSAVVAYVAGRADSLAMFFALLAWLGYERAADPALAGRPWARSGWGGLAVLALLLALGAKEIASVWVALFGGYLAFFRAGTGFRHRVAIFGIALGCLGLYAAARQWPTLPAGVTPPAAPPLEQRYVLIFRALGDYAGLLLGPTRLCMERQVFNAYGPGYNPDLTGYYRSLSLFGPLFLAALLPAAAWPGPARRLRLFGVGWFLTAFLPVSNLFVLNASVAEHWLYVPSVGFGLLLAGLWADFVPAAWRAPVGWAVVGLGGSLLLARTVVRAGDWTERERFVTRTIAAGGDSPRMRNMLAGILARRGDPAGEAMLRDLLQQSPGNTTARLNLAHHLRRQGRLPEAAELYAPLADAAPPRADPRVLPSALAAMRDLATTGLTVPAVGNFPSWEDALAAGWRRFPHSWDLLQLRVGALRREGRPEEALALVRGRVAARPWEYAAGLLLGDLLAERGDVDGSLAAYARAGRLDRRETTTWQRRAALLDAVGRPGEARAALLVARRRHPAPPPP